MKKWLSLVLAALLVFALSACAEQTETKEEENTQSEGTEKENAEDQAKKVRSALLSYQGSVTKLIRSTEAALVAEGADPTAAAATFESDVDAISIPEELKDHSADLEASVSSLKQYYAKKAELLKAGSEDLSEADTFKQEYTDAVTKVFDAVELSPPVFKTLF